jgi:hypothetical protein
MTARKHGGCGPVSVQDILVRKLMSHILRLAVVSLAMVSVAAPAMAQGFGGTPPTPEQRAATFDTADANKDGKLDAAEFKTTIPAQMLEQIGEDRLPMIMTRRDTDGDGSLSKAEFTAPMQRPG